MSPSDELCPCGKSLDDHGRDPTQLGHLRHAIKTMGPLQRIELAGVGVWMVPRAYYALHGLYSRQIPELAQRYGWERIE